MSTKVIQNFKILCFIGILLSDLGYIFQQIPVLKNPFKNPLLLNKKWFLSEFLKVGFVEKYGLRLFSLSSIQLELSSHLKRIH